MAEINLLKKQKEDFAKQQKKAHIAQFIATISVLLLLISGVILFVLKQGYKTTALEEEQAQAKSGLQQMHTKAVKLMFVHDRVSSIKKILADRGAFNTETDILLNQVPQNVSLTSLTISQKKVILAASADSLESLNGFLNNLVALSKQKKVLDTIVLNSLSADVRGGSYTINVDATML